MKVTINIQNLVVGYYELVAEYSVKVFELLGDSVKVDGDFDFVALKSAKKLAEAKAEDAVTKMMAKWTQG